MAEPRQAASRAARMRRAWESYASDDAMFFIATEYRRFTRSWTEGEFYGLGGKEVEDNLRWLGDRVSRGRLLEIGCSLGRHTVHLARRFQHVDGVDISPSMTEQARGIGMPDTSPWPCARARTCRSSPTPATTSATPASCCSTSRTRTSSRPTCARRPGCSAPADGPYSSSTAGPPGRPPRCGSSPPTGCCRAPYRRFVRRYRRSPARLRELVGTAGLALEEERGAGTEAHHMLLARPR